MLLLSRAPFPACRSSTHLVRDDPSFFGVCTEIFSPFPSRSGGSANALMVADDFLDTAALLARFAASTSTPSVDSAARRPRHQCSYNAPRQPNAGLRPRLKTPYVWLSLRLVLNGPHALSLPPSPLHCHVLDEACGLISTTRSNPGHLHFPPSLPGHGVSALSSPPVTISLRLENVSFKVVSIRPQILVYL